MTKVHRVVEAPDELGTEVLRIPAGSDLEIDVRLEAVMEGVLVTGTVRGRATGECVRCLEDVEVEADGDLQELYTHPDRLDGPQEDEDDEVRRLAGDLIDLEPAIRDAIVLDLPFQPVCREDCPGLCSTCGARLETDPQHHHDSVDPRWAALADVHDLT